MHSSTWNALSNWSVYGMHMECMECVGLLLTTKLANLKDLGTCDELLCVSHLLQSSLESRQEARIVHFDFSTAFDNVNH